MLQLIITWEKIKFEINTFMINFRETGICVLKNVLEKKALDLFSTTLLDIAFYH